MDLYRDARDRFVQAPTVDDMATQVNLNALYSMIVALADRVEQLERSNSLSLQVQLKQTANLELVVEGIRLLTDTVLAERNP